MYLQYLHIAVIHLYESREKNLFKTLLQKEKFA